MLHSDKAKGGISQTIGAVAARRPALAPLLASFEPLLLAREECSSELAPLLREKGARLPAFSAEKSRAGVPLLHNACPPAWAVKYAAERLLPLLWQFPPIQEQQQEIAKFFLAEPAAEDPREKLGQALLSGGDIARLADGIDPSALAFVCDFVYSAVFRAMASLPDWENGQPPWDQEGLWQEGYCPFCGSFPAIAWLDRQKFEEQNEFLAGGGGKKHYHCAFCGSSWKFRRGLCPACGREGKDSVNILNVQGRASERIDWCGHCKSYCPTVDLREMADFPNMDVLALGMLHLDMLAAQKKLKPLKAAFWNKF